ncbi:hypothetical protein GW17_00040344, partial [Ensete ventricosum]
QKFKILVIPNVLAHAKSYEHGFRKNTTIINFAQIEFRSIFRAPSQKFKILSIPNILAHGKSYKHNFMKKCDGHKLCAKSSFDQFFVHPFPTYEPIENRSRTVLQKNTTVINFAQSQVYIGFHVPSQKFKILAIPNIMGSRTSTIL